MLSNLKVLAFAPEGGLGMSLRVALAAPHELILRPYPDPALGETLPENADVLILAWQAERSAQIGALATAWRTTHSGPVFALCTGAVEQDVAALLAGADQVLHPPVQGLDIQARVVAHLRLSYAIRKLPGPGAERAVLPEPAGHEPSYGGDGTDGAPQTPSPIRIDAVSHRVFVRDTEVSLTPKEYELLVFLTEHEGKALSRDELLDQVWGINFDTGTNMVDVYVHFLRKKLRVAGLPKVLETVRGRGYRLNVAQRSPRPEPRT